MTEGGETRRGWGRVIKVHLGNPRCLACLVMIHDIQATSRTILNLVGMANITTCTKGVNVSSLGT